jgi:hypothetical protein
VQTPFNGLSLTVAFAATGLPYGSRHIAARSLGNGFEGRLAPSLGRTLEFGLWRCQGRQIGLGNRRNLT